ncbi:MAG: hypothetical protein AAF610_13760 [Pseudomonadota bacterium]
MRILLLAAFAAVVVGLALLGGHPHSPLSLYSEPAPSVIDNPQDTARTDPFPNDAETLALALSTRLTVTPSATADAPLRAPAAAAPTPALAANLPWILMALMALAGVTGVVVARRWPGGAAATVEPDWDALVTVRDRAEIEQKANLDIERLADQLAASQAAVADAENNARALRETVTRLDDDGVEQRVITVAFEKALLESDARLAESNACIANLRSELNDQRAALATTSEQATALKGELADNKAAAARAQNDLRSQLAEFEAHCQERDHTLHERTAELTATVAISNERARECAALTEALAERDQSLGDLNDRLDGATQRLAVLDERCDVRDRQLGDMTSRAHDLTERYNALDAQRRHQQNEIAALAEDLTKKQSRIETLAEQRSERDERLADFGATVRTQTNRISDLSTQLNRERARTADLTEQANAQNQRTDELSAQVKARKKEIDALTRQLEGQQQRNAELTGLASESEQQRDDAVAALGELTARLDALDRDGIEQRVINVEFEKALLAADERLAARASALVAQRRRLDEQAQILADRTRRADALDRQMTRLDEAMAQSRADKDAALAAAQATADKLERAQHDLIEQNRITVQFEKALLSADQVKSQLMREVQRGQIAVDEQGDVILEIGQALDNRENALSHLTAQHDTLRHELDASRTCLAEANDLNARLQRDQLDDRATTIQFERALLSADTHAQQLKSEIDEGQARAADLAQQNARLGDALARAERTLADRTQSVEILKEQTRQQSDDLEAEKARTRALTEQADSLREQNDLTSTRLLSLDADSVEQRQVNITLERALLDADGRLADAKADTREARTRVSELEADLDTSRRTADRAREQLDDRNRILEGLTRSLDHELSELESDLQPPTVEPAADDVPVVTWNPERVRHEALGGLTRLANAGRDALRAERNELSSQHGSELDALNDVLAGLAKQRDAIERDRDDHASTLSDVKSRLDRRDDRITVLERELADMDDALDEHRQTIASLEAHQPTPLVPDHPVNVPVLTAPAGAPPVLTQPVNKPREREETSNV